MPEDLSKATVLDKPSYILGNDGGGWKPKTQTEVNAKSKEDITKVTRRQGLKMFNLSDSKTNLDSRNGPWDLHGRHFKQMDLVICTNNLQLLLSVKHLLPACYELDQTETAIFDLRKKELVLETKWSTIRETLSLVKTSSSPCPAAKQQAPLPFPLEKRVRTQSKNTLSGG